MISAAFKTTTIDALISSAAISLLGVSITETTANGQVNVYDGIDAGGVLAFTLACTAGITNHLIFTEPLLLTRGCYIDIVAGSPSVSVFYL